MSFVSQFVDYVLDWLTMQAQKKLTLTSWCYLFLGVALLLTGTKVHVLCFGTQTVPQMTCEFLGSFGAPYSGKTTQLNSK